MRALLGDDGPQMVQLVADDAAGDRMVTRAGLRGDLHLRAGHRPQPRARPAAPSADVRTSRCVDEAHRAALPVFCWTLRAENAFLPPHLRVGNAPDGLGDALGEARQLLALGVDGLITDSPDHAVRAVARALQTRSAGATAAEVPTQWLERRLAACAGLLRGPTRAQPQSIRSWMTTFSSRPGPTPITLIRAPDSSSSRRT